MKKTITLLSLITILFTACKKETPAKSNKIRKCMDKVISTNTMPSGCTGYIVIYSIEYMYTGNDSVLVQMAYSITKEQHIEIGNRIAAGDTSGICLDVTICNP